jgi:hypothetical protein
MPRNERGRDDKRRPKTYKQPYWVAGYKTGVEEKFDARFSSNSVLSVAEWVRDNSNMTTPTLQFYSGALGSMRPLWEDRVDHLYQDFDALFWLVGKQYAMISSYNSNLKAHDDGWYPALTVNDVFAHVADAEGFRPDQAMDIMALIQRHNYKGLHAWVAHRRAMSPLPEEANDLHYIAAMRELSNGPINPPSIPVLELFGNRENRVRFYEEVFTLMANDKIEISLYDDKVKVLSMLKGEKGLFLDIRPGASWSVWSDFKRRFEPAQPAHTLTTFSDYDVTTTTSRPLTVQWGMHEPNWPRPYDYNPQPLNYEYQEVFPFYPPYRFSISMDQPGRRTSVQLRLEERMLTPRQVNDIMRASEQLTEAMNSRFTGSLNSVNTLNAMGDFFREHMRGIYQDVLSRVDVTYNPTRGLSYDPFSRY